VSRKAHCFLCGYKTRYFKPTVVEVELEHNWNKSVQKLLSQSEEEYKVEFPEGFSLLPDGSGLGRKALEFFSKRRFDLATIQRYRIGVCHSGEMKNRIVLPVFEREHLVYYTGREIFKTSRKYLNPSKKFCPKGKSEFLFNLSTARGEGTAILVEGILDAMRVGEKGVALFGTDLSEIQLTKLLSREVAKVIICLDSDAVIQSVKMAQKISKYIECFVTFLKSGDPADIEDDAGKKIESQAQRFDSKMLLCFNSHS
jgi:hypothetical protein